MKGTPRPQERRVGSLTRQSRAGGVALAALPFELERAETTVPVMARNERLGPRAEPIALA